MQKLQSEEEFNERKEKGKSVFMFSANWCPDCRIIEPFLPELEEKYSHITFIYVDRDQFIDICVSHDIFGIPSFLAFENGKEIDRFVSKDRKSKEEIEEFLTKLG
ncbi:thiol-disulfide isomerase/thioredoxin [Natronobacillus azotifigens]|uniref:Thioredoxin family protein n=1 Tax=Natronobacillus azotifigens TaxID=472978 RepID=A0A9J6RD65_9BACI|nr:thioredoxin family protein [Natronobacillus azotifigens]